MPSVIDSLLRRVEETRDEMAQFTSDLVKFPTVNPPGKNYPECAQFIGSRLQKFGFEVTYYPAQDRPEHTAEFPRINVMGRRCGKYERPSLHLNGHFDVVPPGEGWTTDPFSGKIENGRVYGRGSADMKAGLAAAVFAADAIRREGIELGGALDFSATVDEESGGFAGLGWLAANGLVSSRNTDYVIIPEPFGPDRVCLGHRGVYWFKVTALGKTAHGSMPFLGESAIEGMSRFLESVHRELIPALNRRKTVMPVVPQDARRPTLNINSITGGQDESTAQTPCVADRCEAVFDRRFLPEEDFQDVRNEIQGLIANVHNKDTSLRFELEDLLMVPSVSAPSDGALVKALDRAAVAVMGKNLQKVASPGTYDHKHVFLQGAIDQCVAYGPGELLQAHKPDEFCSIDDMVTHAKVLALAILDLTGSTS